jgi:hypothetical protein
MSTHVKIYIIIFITIALVFAPETTNTVCAHPLSIGESPSILVTVQGTAQFEGASDHSGIKVEMWRDGSSASIIGVVNTDISGNYVFTNVDPAYSYSIVAAASVDGYTIDDLWVLSSSLGASGGTFTASPLVLLKPKQFYISWVYQPNGSTSFISGSPISGSVTLTSSTDKWISLGTINVVGNDYGFCFSEGSIDTCEDFFVSNNHQYPTSLWANNGTGGIHDMGAVSLTSVTEAPDKSNGIGAGQFYNNQATPAVIGHTYAVVTHDGNYYAKFYISEIAGTTIYKVTLPIIIRE